MSNKELEYKLNLNKPRSFSEIMDDINAKQSKEKHLGDPAYVDVNLKKLIRNNNIFQHMQIDSLLFNQFIDICEDQMLSPTHELNKLIENFIKERKCRK